MANPLKAVWRDAKFGLRLLRVLRLFGDLKPDDTRTIADDFEEVIDAHPNKVAFVFEGESTTYRQFEERANRVAAWTMSQDLKPGDVVALDLENCPDFAAIWFGLSKVGVASALINTNLEGEGLSHCIGIVDAKAVIAGGVQAARVKACLPNLESKPNLWDLDGEHGQNLSLAVKGQRATRPDRAVRQHLQGKDTALFIYTSGTTGLPKAAKITHLKIRGTARTSKALVRIEATDRLYITLPLYHITGGGLGLVGALSVGATIILRRKFSASEFWDDVADNNASLFVYIGELCRYLLGAPDHPKQNSHVLRAGFGNGLRGEVWSPFVERFGVPTMRELYGSTEGNVSFLNLDGTIGAIGQMPAWMGAKIGMELVKFDVVEEQPIRGPDGFCIRADVDEPGEVLGKITDVGRQSFSGYHDKKATESKILTDVFERGDKWFRTGDLIRRDANNYLYFVDRIGDTFRWKGENVATNEVADVMSKYPGVELANVYGVEVPGFEGRAGMAALTVADDFSMPGLAQHLRAGLPVYAVPLFLRIQPEAETTGTFKFRKVELVNEGFDPARTEDPIWFLKPDESEFSPLDQRIHEGITGGALRL
ncbi:long-chain-acyl-CoA synthetase [Erythrobacter sp. Alg231-14]|uniref:long-chain-acyl-CoA synthetase n=1 Tax=Erythrobacter sp. Alg231-14 TaxID=1922225 RepID=UPI000D556965